MNNTLKQHVHTLRLSGLLQSLELRLQEAEANHLPYAQFLELLFQDEINVRHQPNRPIEENGASLRAARHLFRFGLDLEHAPRRAGHCNLHFDQVLARSSLTLIKCKLQSHKTLLAKPS